MTDKNEKIKREFWEKLSKADDFCDEYIAMRIQLDDLRQQLHDAKNAHYLSQAHELCTRMGVPPGHIEDRLFEALGKLQ